MEALQFIQITPEALVKLINEGVKIQLEDFKKDFSLSNPDELLTRDQTCNFLNIDSSTLWSWTKKEKLIAYGIGNRRYYKKSEILECLTLLQK